MNVKDLDITHYFIGEKYAKVTNIKAGMKLSQHAHKFDHDAVLLCGKVTLTVEGFDEVIEGPEIVWIEKQLVHEVTALEDSLWVCLWNTDGETDPDKLDESVIA